MLKPPRQAAVAATILFAFLAGAFAAPALAARPLGAFTTRGAWTFYSAPGLHPPQLSTTAHTIGAKLARGYLILSNFRDLGASAPMVGQSGPMILDNRLRPVWFAPVPVSKLATNLQVQSYNGQPALSWWQGVISKHGATVSGEDVVVGQDYRKIASLKGQGGWVISPHEMVISGHNAWVTAYKPVSMSLTPQGGSANGTLLDCAVQEYDLQTGALLYTWDALGHIPLAQAKISPGPANVPWDAYHVNSIQLQPGSGTSGSFLVSMRNTWGVYLVDIATGKVTWTLGGSASNFTFGQQANFSWQHDAQLSRGGLLTLFDDACCGMKGTTFVPANGPARGLVLRLDTTAHTATLVAQYERAKNFLVSFLGSMQLLPGGNALVGWGSRPYFTEFSAGGKVLLNAVLPAPDVSYRARLASWVGQPAFPPAGAVRKVNGRVTVYASWDGATLVAKWRVLAGTSGRHLAPAATARKNGFETSMTVSKSYKVYKVQALDRKGRVLGSSALFPRKKVTIPFY
ncbi:MAG TPA: arylsulfotransferase family protein [Solirubrobacteraceae bacterium]